MTSRRGLARLSRRDGNGSLISAPPAYTIGLKDFEANNSYYKSTSLGDAPQGSTTMSIAVAFRVDTIPDSTNQQNCFITGSRAAPRGYYFECISGRARFQLSDGGALGVVAPLYFFAGSDEGKCMLFHGTYDGAVVRMYRQGVEVGLGTAAAGYTAPDPLLDQPHIGSNYGGDRVYSLSLIGVACSDTTIVNPATHYAAVVAAGNMVGFTGCTQMWVASNSNNGSGPWAASVGSTGMIQGGVGTGPTAAIITPNWAS